MTLQVTFQNLLRPPRPLGLAAAAIALCADQAHKYWMIHVFDIKARAPIRLTPFLDLLLSWNIGVSYSLFAAHSEITRLALTAIQLAIIAGVSVLLWRAQTRLAALGFGLIIGGALGNVADRLFRGAVADFFYFHTTLPVGPLANYVFNIADAAITLGVALLLVETLFSTAPAGQESERP